MQESKILMRRKAGLHYGWIIAVVSIVIVMGALGLGRFGYTMILSSMKSGLSLSETAAGDLATGNMLGYMVMASLAGFLASRFSPRLIITSFMILIAFSCLLTGLASNFSLALWGRILTGIGSAGTNIPVMGLLMAWFVREKRGLATGLAVSGSSFGLFVTGLLLPTIINQGGELGWRYAWYCLSGLTFLIALIGLVFLRNKPAEKGLLPIGVQDSSVPQAPESSAVPPAANTGTASSVRANWRHIYLSGQVWYLAFIYILFGFSYIIFTTFFGRYLQNEAHFSPADAGLLWSAIGGASVISGFIWGALSDRIGRKFGLALVFGIQGLCFLIFGLWRALPGYYLASLLFAITAWSIPAIMAATAGDMLGPRLAAAALGFITLFLGFGQVLGPFIAGRIAQVTSSYAGAFILAGLAALSGGLLSLFINSSSRNPAKNQP